MGNKYEGLRWDDQEKIKENIGGSDITDGPKHRSLKYSDYSIEYAKSAQAKCRQCEVKIEKGVVRISKLGFPDEAKKKGVGRVPRWRHVDCFIVARSEIDATELVADQIPGFEKLKDEDQKEVVSKFGVPIKKEVKEESVQDEKPAVSERLKEALKIQNKKFWEIRDGLFKNCDNRTIKEILEVNNCETSGGESRILDRCADGIMFGALE